MAAVLALLPPVLILTVAARRAQLEAPEPTPLVLDRQGRFLGALAEEPDADQGFWPLGQVPPRIAAATLAAEDRRFFQHPGVDPKAVLRAAAQNLRHRQRISGASTLAMQVARMQRPGPRRYLRKMVEASTALWLTARFGREAVLAHYFRIAPYGHRMRGVAYACRRLFAKPVQDLSWAEAAFLAAIPQSPSRMDPYDPLGRARAVRRAQRILDQLGHSGVLTAADLALAHAELRQLRLPAPARRPEETLHTVLWLGQEAKAGRLPSPSRPLLRSTLDLELQQRVAAVAERRLHSWRSRGAGNVAVLVVERETAVGNESAPAAQRSRWEVRAAVASANYFAPTGAIDYLRLPRSSGSTLKPFLYALAMERGLLSPGQILDDLQRGPGGIGNSDGRFLGPMLPRVALANSRNVPAAELLARLGSATAFSFLEQLGLHDGEGAARRYGAGLAIGGLPVTLESLVRAYTALAGEGQLGSLQWLQGQAEEAPSKVLSEAVARQITLFLADPQARLPTFARMGHSEYPFAAAVKTGTSSRYRDSWAVVYTRRYLLGVWVGHPDHRPMAGLSGYQGANRLAREILVQLHEEDGDGLQAPGFAPPREHIGLRLCALSGHLAGDACDRVTREYFPARGPLRPTQTCSVHRHLAVDRRNGLLATARTPRAEVEVRSFAQVSPRYRAWAASAGLPQPPAGFSPLGGSAGQGEFGVAAGPGRPNASDQALRPAVPGPVVPRFAVSQQPLPEVRITSPRRGLRLLRDPEAPDGHSTLALRATVEPGAEQVVWFVNGRPFRTVGPPFSVRWPLSPGEHVFEARVPFSTARSQKVAVWVE